LDQSRLESLWSKAKPALRHLKLFAVAVTAVGVIATLAGAFYARRQYQVAREQLELQKTAPALECVVYWPRDPVAPDEETLATEVDALYNAFFNEVSEFLAQNPQCTYVEALDSILPISRQLPEPPENQVRVAIRNVGQSSERFVRVCLTASDETIVDIDPPEGITCEITTGGLYHKHITYTCDELVSQQAIEMGFTLRADEGFRARLEIPRERNRPPYDWHVTCLDVDSAQPAGVSCNFFPRADIVDGGIVVRAIRPSVPMPIIEVHGLTTGKLSGCALSMQMPLGVGRATFSDSGATEGDPWSEGREPGIPRRLYP